jgi:hypothetical protein
MTIASREMTSAWFVTFVRALALHLALARKEDAPA